ncbi:MAG TPA: hypothetical protein ACQGQJ_02865 [Xylella fastidiosa subsp. multiplex]
MYPPITEDQPYEIHPQTSHRCHLGTGIHLIPSSQAAGSPGVEHRTQAFLEDLAKGGGHRSKPCRLPTHAKCL